ncbi:RRM1_TatSF1_like and RRM2_TatSF1_like domain-containing protein barc isoform X2 [Musca autumnalis]
MSESQQDETSDIGVTETEREEEKSAGTKDNTIIDDNNTITVESVGKESENVNLENKKPIPPSTEDTNESVTETSVIKDTEEDSKFKENFTDNDEEWNKKLKTTKTKSCEDSKVCEESEGTNKQNVADRILDDNSKVIADSAEISQSSPSKNEITTPQNVTESAKSSPENKTPEEKQSSELTKDSSSSAKPSKDDYAEHVTYTEDGNAIYTDPATKYQYKWCTKTNNWIPLETQSTSSTSTTTNPYENEHYKWCQETQKWIPKQQAQVTETDHYKWDNEKQQWIPKNTTADQNTNPSSTDIVYDIDEDGQRIYTDRDGTVYFWDVDKNAWFPKIDEDFMARYQMSYGFIDNTTQAENEKREQELKAAELKEKELQKMTEEAKKSNEDAAKGPTKRKIQEPPKWFEIDPEHNTKVYVSNLPLDITLDEFAEVMGKCGMIMRDPQTQKLKLKLYSEADGQLKGDGLCDYIKVESVHLALKILDEYDLRGHKMRVQRAQFQMRGEYNPALKPKRKKKDKEKLAKIKEKLFDWRPEKMRGERFKHEKSVIIKNLFHPDLFEKEVQLILDYQNDLREECSKCGTVRKVIIYDRHSEGVAQVNMSTPDEADLVIQMMHGRFFGKRQLTAEHWDGKTKYKIEETEEEIQKRLNKWDNFLETDKTKPENVEKPNVEDIPTEKTELSTPGNNP